RKTSFLVIVVVDIIVDFSVVVELSSILVRIERGAVGDGPTGRLLELADPGQRHRR
ncbi:MAG: hypothetical protein QOE30_1768, partial [Mycobacterium sp.]|nr:hypothetical protein [Mycobacterium sp.]